VPSAPGASAAALQRAADEAAAQALSASRHLERLATLERDAKTRAETAAAAEAKLSKAQETAIEQLASATRLSRLSRADTPASNAVDGLDALSATELKRRLAERGLSSDGCAEKADMAERLRAATAGSGGGADGAGGGQPLKPQSRKQQKSPRATKGVQGTTGAAMTPGPKPVEQSVWDTSGNDLSSCASGVPTFMPFRAAAEKKPGTAEKKAGNGAEESAPQPPAQDAADGEVAFNFTKVSDSAFDRGGVLYAIGTDWGRAAYSNPADSGKVAVGWSKDAANYYSTAGGHKRGDASQAASVICSHTHPGAAATQWSLGEPRAYFQIDLRSVLLKPNHFAYRGDYGGGGNHPRTFELQGSSDGVKWTTLSQQGNVSWSGKQGKAWPIKGAAGHFRIFRIQNLGTPNNLCCSGIELYGLVKGADGQPAPLTKQPSFAHGKRLPNMEPTSAVAADAKCAPCDDNEWEVYENIDMCRQGDVEIIWNWKATHSVDDLKRIVMTKNYSAFTISNGKPSFGHAALKSFRYNLTKEHCKPISTCCKHPCKIYIWTGKAKR